MAGRAYVTLDKELTRIGSRRTPGSRSKHGFPRDPRKWLFTWNERHELRKAWQVFRSCICSSQRKNAALHGLIDANGKAFARLATSREPLELSEVLDGLKAAAASGWDALAPRCRTRPCVRLRTSSRWRLFAAPVLCRRLREPHKRRGQWIDRDRSTPTYITNPRGRAKHMFLAHRLVEEYLRGSYRGTGKSTTRSTRWTISTTWPPCAGTFSTTWAVRLCQATFTDFSDSGPAQALFFGCEPFLLARDTLAGRDEQLNMSLPPSTRTTAAPYTSISPRSDMAATRSSPAALKAVFFEAVLSDSKRQENGSDMPLVAYVGR